MKLYHKNPRRISDKQFSQLAEWLAELGDLSGIVHDLNSDEIVGGNQRGRVFDIDQCEIVLTEQYADPDSQGTLGLGYILWQGNKYAYRQVRWTERQCEKANIVANKAGGTWDFDVLANTFAVDDLLAWGFEPVELGVFGEEIDPNEEWEGMPEFKQSEESTYQSIHVHFATIEDANRFAQLIEQNITEKTKFIWYPAREKTTHADKRYADES